MQVAGGTQALAPIWVRNTRREHHRGGRRPRKAEVTPLRALADTRGMSERVDCEDSWVAQELFRWPELVPAKGAGLLNTGLLAPSRCRSHQERLLHGARLLWAPPSWVRWGGARSDKDSAFLGAAAVASPILTVSAHDVHNPVFALPSPKALKLGALFLVFLNIQDRPLSRSVGQFKHQTVFSKIVPWKRNVRLRIRTARKPCHGGSVDFWPHCLSQCFTDV